MKLLRVLGCLATITTVSFSSAGADVILNVTANGAGGTNWEFSGGTGTVSGTSGQHFLPAESLANPQPFVAANHQDTDGLTVISGVDLWGFDNIFVRDYNGLSGTNGAIYDGIDFQISANISGNSISDLNGLVLHADDISISAFNTGTYILDNYYAGYGATLGQFTLIVGQAADHVPAPAALGLFGLGIAGLGMARRRRA